jgi:hypothetical protein
MSQNLVGAPTHERERFLLQMKQLRQQFGNSNSLSTLH